MLNAGREEMTPTTHCTVCWTVPSIFFMLPVATCKLLSACLFQRYIKYPSKHLLAKVLAAAQK